MFKSIKDIFKLLPQSVYDKFNKISSVRIQALLTFGVIGLSSLIFLGIEISSAVIALIATGKYVLSNQILGVFAALLAHHIALLFNKRKEYSKDETIDTTPAVGGVISEDTKKEQELG